MRLFERIAIWFGDSTMPAASGIGIDGMVINPATGLLTIAGAGTSNAVGNPYGFIRPHDCEYD